MTVTTIEDSTQVDITLPNGVTGSTGTISRSGGTPFSTTLNAYQILTVKSNGDLTGTLVTANKKISLSAGAQKLKSHENCTTLGHTAEHVMPTQVWGMDYIYRSMTSGMVNYLRILGTFMLSRKYMLEN